MKWVLITDLKLRQRYCKWELKRRRRRGSSKVSVTLVGDYEQMLIMDFVAFQFTLQFLSIDNLIQLKQRWKSNLFASITQRNRSKQCISFYKWNFIYLEVVSINNFAFGGFVGAFLGIIFLFLFLYLTWIGFKTNFERNNRRSWQILQQTIVIFLHFQQTNKKVYALMSFR